MPFLARVIVLRAFHVSALFTRTPSEMLCRLISEGTEQVLNKLCSGVPHRKLFVEMYVRQGLTDRSYRRKLSAG